MSEGENWWTSRSWRKTESGIYGESRRITRKLDASRKVAFEDGLAQKATRVVQGLAVQG